jgi:hypothetical protein
MKKYMGLIVQFKFVWGLFFTASILLYTAISMILGNESMEFTLIWKFVTITILLTFIYYLIWGEFILTKASSKHKLIIHFILCYITLLIFTSVLDWMVITNLYHVAIFSAYYTVLYLSIIFSLYMYYKGTGEVLNDRLAIYKARKQEN